jgi:hypothetical protein
MYTRCDDAARFLGCAGKRELESLDRTTYEAINAEFSYDDQRRNLYFDRMEAESGPNSIRARLFA